MICPNCGTMNGENSKFCIKCGSNLVNNVSNQNNISMNNTSDQLQTQTVGNSFSNVNNQNVQQASETVFNSQTMTQDFINNSNINNNNNGINNNTINTTNNIGSSTKIAFANYFYILLAVILKPFTAFKEELTKFNEFKNSAMLALIVSGVATLITLFKTMLNVVRVTSLWSSEVKWVWKNLKNVQYFKVIGTNFLIYIGIIVAIAGIYYLASLIIKKQVDFSRLLGIASASIVPIVLCSLVLSPILTMIHATLGTGISIVGGIYTLILVYETINNEIMLEGNTKFYFNLICLSILIIAGYYLYMKFFMSSITNNLDSVLDMFR